MCKLTVTIICLGKRFLLGKLSRGVIIPSSGLPGIVNPAKSEADAAQQAAALLDLLSCINAVSKLHCLELSVTCS